jgi:hypothetical protein
MSSNTQNINTTEDSVVFSNFINFMSSYELTNPGEENHYIQRLKIIAARSGQFVQFKVLDGGYYLVHTEHEVPISGTFVIGQYTIDQLVPFRSALIKCDSTGVKLVNYTINRVKSISNADFSTLAHQKYVSYEGTIILVYHNGDEWIARTTSCPSAFDSHFNTDSSHGSSFLKVASMMRGLPETSVLSDVMDGLSVENYYVFLLVSPETRYLCNYEGDSNFVNGSKVFMLNVRNADNYDVENTTVFESQPVIQQSDIDTMLSLTVNTTFAKKYLPLQGFIVKSDDGSIFRTFTHAYYYGSNQIPNHGIRRQHITFLHCYLKNSLSTYMEMNNLDDFGTVLATCRNTVLGLRNILAFLFTSFTNFTVESVNGTDGNSKIKKSYTKRNGDLYTALSECEGDETKNIVDTYKRAVAMLQGHAVNGKTFTDTANLADDVEHFIRTLANNQNKSVFQMIVTMLMNYNMFKTKLIATIKSINNARKQIKKSFVQTIKEFNNRHDAAIESFVAMVNDKVVHESENDVDVVTRMVPNERSVDDL